MREFSSDVLAALASDNVSYFFLIELGFSTTYRFTSFSRDIVFEENTYIADGGLFEFDSPKNSSVVDREAYKVILTDLTDNLYAEFKLNVVGKDIKVMVGFLDSNNEPLLGTNDIVYIYKGYVDSPSIQNNWETKLAVFEGSSPMADLDQVNLTMVSGDGMDQLSSTDTSYDHIYDDSEIQLKWGKL